MMDRVAVNKCNGFMGLYSTVPSSGLVQRLEGLSDIEHAVYDHRKIELSILRNEGNAIMFKRYFPKSFERWIKVNPGPAKIFSDQDNPRCIACGRDLLEEQYIGNIIQWSERKVSNHLERIVDVYCCCKNLRCSRPLEAGRHAQGWDDVWEDISDMAIPSIYIARLMGFANALQAGVRFEEKAFNDTKIIFLKLFSHVSRHLTADERSRTTDLLMLPSWAGGIGKD